MDSIEPGKKTCVVIATQELVIAADLKIMLAEVMPNAEIILARSLVESGDRLPVGGKVDIAFIDADPDTFERSSLANRMCCQQAYVIFLGRSRGAWSGPPNMRWSVLDYPFSREDFMQLIRPA